MYVKKISNHLSKGSERKKHLNTFIIAVFDSHFRFEPHPSMKPGEIFWGNKMQRDGILKEDVNQSKYQDSVLW